MKKEHENTKKDSEPARHLKKFPDHAYTWKIIMSASTSLRTRRNLEGGLIAKWRPIFI